MSNPRASALLVVDMSVEQVGGLPSKRKALIVQSIQKLLSLENVWRLCLDSRLWLHSDTESTLSRVYPEWGVSMGIPGSPGAALLPELQHPKLQFVEKKHYSSFVDTSLLETLRRADIDDVYIVGINTDFCIFNTAMDSFARGKFHTVVVEEGVGSICGTAGHQQGLAWIRAHMGSNAVVSLDQVIKNVASGNNG